MSVQLKNTYIKTKIKATFGELEVYNIIDKNKRSELSQMIRDNSKPVTLENGMSDLQINNMNKTMRYLLINATNIENAEYWNNLSDEKLEEMLDLCDGDFKQVVNALLDIVFEIAQDNRLEDIRKLDVIKGQVIEMTEVFKFNTDINKVLAKFGIDKELLNKISNGDKEAIEKFQQTLIEQANKPKKTRTKKTK